MLLTDYLQQGALLRPHHPALFWQNQIITFAELQQQVHSLAAGLAALGFQPGERLGILLPNGAPFVWGYYAAALLGGTVVPANPALKPAELEYLWKDAGVSFALAAASTLPAAQAARQNLPALRHILTDIPCSEAASISETMHTYKNVHLPSPSVTDDHCAVILYTSGTTGRPKGAMLSHKNLTRNVEQTLARLPFTQNDAILTVLPLFHAFAATVCMNVALASGMTSVMLESFSPAKVLEAIQTQKITVLPAVPAMFQALLAVSPHNTGVENSLRMLVSGGAPLPVSLISLLEERFNAPVLEGDGPTECSPVTSVNPLEGPRKPGTVGPALPGVEIEIWSEEGNPLHSGETGEIVVRGDNVMLGYLNLPEATAEAMQGGWYHTGDIGTKDTDGYVAILDRKKDMIITSGLNVYPREVEETLRSHPAVLDAAVIGLADGMRGEMVTAVVVLRQGAEAKEREIVQFCRARMADYKAPRRVLFRTALPLGGTGKVVKRLLKKELEMEGIA